MLLGVILGIKLDIGGFRLLYINPPSWIAASNAVTTLTLVACLYFKVRGISVCVGKRLIVFVIRAHFFPRGCLSRQSYTKLSISTVVLRGTQPVDTTSQLIAPPINNSVILWSACSTWISADASVSYVKSMIST